MSPNTAEHLRLNEIQDELSSWRLWGPYLGDRSWGNVREDYSADGNPWEYLPHELARSKAYRWGDDGIAGLCDRYQLIIFAPAFWNGVDPILKERLFGVGQGEGNHGEDVKEYYYYLDNIPSHAYMKFQYKYPQSAFPYQRLVDENRARGGKGFEFELIDTGIFDEDRYFDVTVEYAKVAAADIVVRITAVNRGPDPAPLDVIPHLWFRNTWSWTEIPKPPPAIRLAEDGPAIVRLVADRTAVGAHIHINTTYSVGPTTLYAPAGGTVLFTDNETNGPRVFGPGNQSRSPFVKDAFHRHIIQGQACVNPAMTGTKAAIRYHADAVPPGGSFVREFRISSIGTLVDPLAEVGTFIDLRRAEADEFHATLRRARTTDDEAGVQRQAYAGLLWSKQCYLFDVARWLDGDNPLTPPPPNRREIRNTHWRHVNSMRVMSLPDKWEYPWFAAWDLAFQSVAIAPIDPKFAMDQLWMLLFEQFQHPNGQLPAFEWEFSDLNPPVHAWAVWRVYNMARIRTGAADRAFLERCFHKLMLNFTWWINRVDTDGSNIFEGGFLGMDNVSAIDRGKACAGGAILEQADATGWMGMFCLNMMRIALELAKENAVYEGLATKFFQHYAYVAAAMKTGGEVSLPLWDHEDGFFYDRLRHPDGRHQTIRVRSMVGLIPLFAVERLELDWIEPFTEFRENLNWFLNARQDLVKDVVHRVEREGKTTLVLTILNPEQIGRTMQRLWDSDEFLSDYGIRSLSKIHEREPFYFEGTETRYEPAESDTKIMGGNSNWRGPIWFPTNFLLIESIRKLGTAFGADFAVPTPATHGINIHFIEMSQSLADRLISIFSRNEQGKRPVHGGVSKFQDDPLWNDLILYYEYFHGDLGAGLGASHQTGWTALVASLIDEWRI